MIKDWDDAPWANYRAYDQNGRLYYYENKPVINSDSSGYYPTGGRCEYSCTIRPWDDSLEERPKINKKLNDIDPESRI